MNYVFRERMLQFFVRQNMSAQTFAESLVKLLHQYPAAATRSMFNLLGSHDTERVLTLAQDMELVKRMLTVQFTYPGIPMVYYGDEAGMFGGADPDCRRGMVWEETKQNQAVWRTFRCPVRGQSCLRAERVVCIPSPWPDSAPSFGVPMFHKDMGLMTLFQEWSYANE